MLQKDTIAQIENYKSALNKHLHEKLQDPMHAVLDGIIEMAACDGRLFEMNKRLAKLDAELLEIEQKGRDTEVVRDLNRQL